jgi:DUF971 family protein
MKGVEIEKIKTASNHQLVIKWSDKKIQPLEAFFVQSRCPCILCSKDNPKVEKDVKIESYEVKGRLGLKILFSSGCSRGIYPFSEIRSWLEESLLH